MDLISSDRPSRGLSRIWSGKYALLLILLVAGFILITLLNIGYYWQRGLEVVARQKNLADVVNIWNGTEMYIWLAAVPVALWLIRRSPLVPGRIGRSLTQLTLGAVGIYAAVANFRYILRMLPNVTHLSWGWPTYLDVQLLQMPINLLNLGGLFAISFAIDYYFQSRQRAEEALQMQLRAARLQSELARAHLSVLQGQLQPHFLFNAFNAIANLVRQKRLDTAVETIAQVSALLRLTMEEADCQEVALEKELEFIRHYLAVEQVRFGDKLKVHYDVAPEALAVPVPRLILQPIVGNSVKHAISRRTTGGALQIRARAQSGRLALEVTDDGPGDSPGPLPISTGIGLVNTRARLEALYPGDFRLDLIARPEGGMVVRLDLPQRLTSVAQEASP